MPSFPPTTAFEQRPSHQLTKVFSASVVGIEAEIVEVEVDVSPGLPNVIIVGLPDIAVKEARERVKSAIKNSHSVFPTSRVAVNLAPADLPKNGTHFDLPIAISILANSGQLKFDSERMVFLGELSLDGKVRGVSGVLSTALSAKQRGFMSVMVPEDNAAEATLVGGLEVIPVKSLQEAVAHLQNLRPIQPAVRAMAKKARLHGNGLDMRDIKGQEQAKRALEIAAAGSHNILMIGPPGSGKTILARTFPTILPQLSEEEMLEVTKIYSVAGALSGRRELITTRPFRSPHHTASAVSLVGGGSIPRPGEISLAHRGVLFLDELPEFNQSVLESLRQPMEDGIVTIARASGAMTFPARFTLVAAQNPCPCGYYNDPDRPCTCSPGQIQRYNKKVSGPLLDRIDLCVQVPRISYDKITKEAGVERSADLQNRVEDARSRQTQRFSLGETASRTNAEMGIRELKQYSRLNEESHSLLKTAIETLHLSTRSYSRILKIARTIADLSGEANIRTADLAEALLYRPGQE
ncbi:MAG: hypothetical protein A2722_03760 [Candidatus Doudnabacteria bacterium RIFCSPHIGHO2_01_FULL_50_11]|uniref:MCM C-terminal AAA(+) ATPase domain-containing protein n=1 Tax=Candidatus Doudnabacteria bacterium RIFCSPHIGHO2_01_FULL_50_11 TaxID=1817828 RepID=A0A1F5PJQ2_9BACT|nr:MAG: hypothetical protein A2722_03760 [Candidatus Doudnabacteria bacterium RIFCSPHIGHO2_01_FULL_50_11]HLC44603.1 YifB family Mg chelatase-like AAA ATPase [Patescibacteria group bacterium]